MDKKSIKNSVLVVIFVVLAPLILVGLTALGNTIGIKGNPSTNATQTTEKAAKVPEETKSTTNNDIPKADDKKISNNTSSNNKDKNQNSGTVSSTPIAGQSYVVKTGDTLFTIASSAYGEGNAQSGIDKIKQANNMNNNNLTVGQKIQIPKSSLKEISSNDDSFYFSKSLLSCSNFAKSVSICVSDKLRLTLI